MEVKGFLSDYVVVTWKDSGTHHANGWQTPDQIRMEASIEYVTTVGFLFHLDAATLYIGQTHDADYTHFFGTQLISIPDVKDIRHVYFGPKEDDRG